jgi:uncharacterized protein YcbK (DUF882 family)
MIKAGVPVVPGGEGLLESVEAAKILAKEILQPIRNYYNKPTKINSAFRSLEVNRLVGGSSNSHHCKGQAADITIAGITTSELATWIKDNLKFTQVIIEFYTKGLPKSGWVHVSYDPADLKCQALTASKENGKTIYKNGLIHN